MRTRISVEHLLECLFRLRRLIVHPVQATQHHKRLRVCRINVSHRFEMCNGFLQALLGIRFRLILSPQVAQVDLGKQPVRV